MFPVQPIKGPIFLLLLALAGCGGSGGGGGNVITLPPEPSLSFTSSVASSPADTSFTLTWSTSNVESCAASGSWSGDKGLSGSETISESQPGGYTYTLTCTGEGGDVEAEVDVAISDASGDEEAFTVSSTNPDCQGTLFHSPSVLSDYLDRVIGAYTYGCEYLGDIRPLEIWLTANNESEASALRDRWCAFRLQRDPTFREAWCQNSQIGVNLANYVRWSSVYYDGLASAHHQNNLSAFSNDPNDLSAEYVTIHEFFHAYQFDHLDEAIYGRPEERDIHMGRTQDGSRPWHSEGSADFFGHLLTELAGHPGALKQYFENAEFCTGVVDDAFSLWNLTYDDSSNCGYPLGAWAIAYLISQHSVEAYFAFYDDLNGYGFFEGWEKNFGQTTDEFDVSFRDWVLATTAEERLSMIEHIVADLT